jgi:protein phosphatase
MNCVGTMLPIWRMRDSSLLRPIELPAFCVVVMVGISGAGKSTFTRKHFIRTQILSSDSFRGLVSDDENDQSATKDAFDSLYFIAARRLARGRLTVIDATSLRPQDREGYVQLALRFHCPAIAVVLNLPENVCLDRNRVRNDRNLQPETLRCQSETLRLHLANLEDEGFSRVYVLSTPQEIEVTRFVRV